MPHHMAFCSACDRPVPVDFTSDARPNARPEYPDAAELVCLEYPARCTGSMCPMVWVPGEMEAVRAMRDPELPA